MEDEVVIRLSDAFQNKEVDSSVKVTVSVINMNHGHNEKLMAACKCVLMQAADIEIHYRKVNRLV